jgi:hypothetical protein
MAERKKLTVTSVDEPKAIGDKGAIKLQFRATDGEKELAYFTFSKRLFGQIKQGAVIDADVETTEKPSEYGVFIDRRVTKIYTDGQPTKQRSWGGSSDKSIEWQVALKEVGLCWREGKDIPQDILASYFNALRATLGARSSAEPPKDTEPEATGVASERLTGAEKLRAAQLILTQYRDEHGLSKQGMRDALGCSFEEWMARYPGDEDRAVKEAIEKLEAPDIEDVNF